jgi:hypothetical protein
MDKTLQALTIFVLIVKHLDYLRVAIHNLLIALPLSLQFIIHSSIFTSKLHQLVFH